MTIVTHATKRSATAQGANAGFSPWRPGFTPRAAQVGFTVDDVALVHVSLRVFRSPQSIKGTGQRVSGRSLLAPPPRSAPLPRNKNSKTCFSKTPIFENITSVVMSYANTHAVLLAQPHHHVRYTISRVINSYTWRENCIYFKSLLPWRSRHVPPKRW
jgi:hypothetical protein